MVSSLIDKNYNYKEQKEIDDKDIGYSTSVYEMELFDKIIYIVLGKQELTPNGKISYYRIYIVLNDKIKSQIGIYEIETEKTINILDEDGEPDLTQFDEPLLFSFVSEKFINKINSSFQKEVYKKEEVNNEYDEKNDFEKEEDDDIFKVNIPAKKQSKTHKELEDIKIDDGIFIVDKNFEMPELLKEETTNDSENIKTQFKESSQNSWIQIFLKNNQFEIVENDGGGDCFFYTIIDAFNSIGKTTTIAKLRLLLANEITNDILQEQKNLYIGFEEEKKIIEKELQNIKETVEKYAKNIKKITDKDEKQKIIIEVKKFEQIFKDKKQQLIDTTKQQEEYVGFIKNINTLDDYKDYIQTSQYWADSWAISTLERLLNVKFIIFSKESYGQGSLDSVLQCGENNKLIEEKGVFSPQFFIMINFINNNHFELITYKNKKILKFSEIPYSIKILIVNKCLEKNSGIFNLINDFKNFKNKLGINDDEDDEDIIDENDNLFDPEIVFVFHNKSDDKKAPGAGSGEQIPKSQIKDFINLKNTEGWRRKLDDFYDKSVFTVDKKRWCSIVNYLQGSKYKKTNPDIYNLFSLDSDTPFSKDAELANKVSNTGKLDKTLIISKNVKPDTDYEENKNEYRRQALEAKFGQNEDLKQMLLNTQNAKLNHFVRGYPPKIDNILMEVRKSIK